MTVLAQFVVIYLAFTKITLFPNIKIKFMLSRLHCEMLDSNNLIHWDNVCLTDPDLFFFQLTKLSFRQTSRMSGQLESLVRVSV